MGMQVTVPAPGRPVEQASPPQQSLSLWHRSPKTWQPDAGWQMFTPLAANGAHRREQQSPQPLHTVPSTAQLTGELSAPQVPAVAPEAMLQMPVQQSAAR